MTTKTRVTPIGDHILVRQESAASESDGGIILPDAAQEAANRGRVVAVGSGKLLQDGRRADMQVSEGDVITFQPGYGTMAEIEVDGETLLVIKEDSVLCIHG